MREEKVKQTFNECAVGKLVGIEVTELKGGTAGERSP